MTAPIRQVVQMTIQNPDASIPLIIPVEVVCNTSDADLERNIRASSQLPLKWVAWAEPHDRAAIMCGGGASLADHVGIINGLEGDVFAMNGASAYLSERGVPIDFQVIADAKRETSQLVDKGAKEHLFASQVHADTIAAAGHPPTLWHLETGNVEAYFPPEKVSAGGYCLIGGGAAVGNSALCVAYAKGYRTFHIFGFDSCHSSNNRSHAYDQPMNDLIPCVDVSWAGRTFKASVAMKAQAEKFQITAQALEQAGCTLHVYGEGLLQSMWRTPPENLTERDKYRTLWQFDLYRLNSPGEEAVDTFLEVAKPRSDDGIIIDFGCGTGRAALKLDALGFDVMLVDFADNCRDEEAMTLPFLEWDLTQPCPLSAKTGFCSDVMEHIPTDDVDQVIYTIMGSARRVFFQISTVADDFGQIVHQKLHNTVMPHAWWADKLAAMGFALDWQEEGLTASRFLVRNLSDRKN